MTEAPSRRRRVATDLLVFLTYTAVSCLYFGRQLLPHPGRFLIGNASRRDPEIFLWSFAWWPHAIATWTNPFVSHAIYAPKGVNLTWTTSVPGLAIAFAPVAALFGPDVSYNLASLLAPALSAWTAYLLCRYLTRSTWAALVGGYLFGFSTYLLGQQFAGHLHTTSVFLVPLVALVVIRHIRGELDGRGLAWRLGLLLGAQLYISTELTLTLAIAFVVALVLALALLPDARGQLARSIGPIAAACPLAALLALPFLAYALGGFVNSSFGDPAFFDADLLNIFVPTRLTGLGGSALHSVSGHFPGYDEERGSYLGLPALLVVALFALRTRRSAGTRFLLVALAAAMFLALGTSLHVNGHRVVALPWSLVSGQPLLDNVIPARFAVYASLAAAVIVALWIASTRGRILRRPVLLPLLAVAALVPAVWQVDYRQLPERWAFFSRGLYKQCIPHNETLAIFPFGRWGDSMLWQAESGFWFRMAEGNMGRDNYPPNFVFEPVVSELMFEFTNPDIRPALAQLLAYGRRHRVDRFISIAVHAYPNGTMMHGFGAVQLLGGALVAPACGHISLTDDRSGSDPREPDFGGRAAYTALLDIETQLRHLHAVLGGGRPSPTAVSAAETALRRVQPTLDALRRFDPTATRLSEAALSIARAESTLRPLARPAPLAALRLDAALVSSRRSIDDARRALGTYAAAINAA